MPSGSVTPAGGGFTGGTVTHAVALNGALPNGVPLTIGGGLNASNVDFFTIHDTDGAGKDMVSFDDFGVLDLRKSAGKTNSFIDFYDDNGNLVLSIAGDGSLNFSPQAGSTPVVVNQPSAQSTDLAVIGQGFSPFATFLRVTKNGYLGIQTHAAPADAEVATGEAALWFDQTNGAAKLMVKGKTANGTVVAASIALA